MNNNQSLHRRHFLRMTGLTGVALMLGVRNTESATGTVSELVNLSAAETFEITPFVIIDTNGVITIMNNKPEMGQGTYQSIPALIAEELEVSLDKVVIKQTAGEAAFGGQTSGGSFSVRGSYQQLRKTGATAKEMLLLAAAEKWKAAKTDCYAKDGFIHHQPSGNKLSYGELVAAASKLPVPSQPTLKDPSKFNILGKNAQRPDIPLKVSGKAVFGIDAEVPGMVYASIARCPVFGAKLVSFTDTDAKKLSGVSAVMKVKRIYGKCTYEGVAVVANSYWAALQGKKALKIDWDYGDKKTFDSTKWEAELRNKAKDEGIVVHTKGNFEEAFEAAPVKMEAMYETPMVSHSPMEPMNCTAKFENNQLEVWVSIQGPDIIKRELSKVLDIPKDNIKVNVLFNGGGFGRRLYTDFVVEAAFIAKEIGKPVKVIWTREEDTQLGPFRPQTFSAMKAALNTNGEVAAFQHKVIAPSLRASGNPQFDKTKADGTMVEGISEQQYQFGTMKNAYVYVDSHIPFAAWRSVTSSTLAFAHECFIDELAAKAGKDAMDYRIQLMKKDSDAQKVLIKLKNFANWEKPLPAGWGRGVAQYEFFAGLAAFVVEVSKQKEGGVKIEKVYCAIDLGTVVNPDNVKAQMEGSVAMALTAAIKSGIQFKEGQTVQTNFHNNPLLRMKEMPKVEVLIIADGGNTIKGVGEPGLPPVAPALVNAIYAATGKRIRKLPFDINKIA